MKSYNEIYKSVYAPINGLSEEKARQSRKKYGANAFTKTKKPSFLSRFFKSLSEPMTIILEFALIITLGVNVGNLLAGKPADFYESAGILASITVSALLSAVMESKSEKAFEMLEKFNKSITVNVVRGGEVRVISYADVCVGDLILCEAGDKVTADGVIIDCVDLTAEESVLTGESRAVKKQAHLSGNITENNMLWSGTYIRSGSAKISVLAVGDSARIGKIAGGLSGQKNVSAPLNQKLSRLGAGITIFGAIMAAIVFALTLFRLNLSGGLTAAGVKDAFIDAIVLIVAAVPEGLPTTVAISLALSVVKLAKSNAIIKKLVAAETVGCVSVICSDKTGTLTVGKMQAERFILKNGETLPENLKNEYIFNNIAINSTAEIYYENGKKSGVGSYTEQALLWAIKPLLDYKHARKRAKIGERLAFNSKNKYMVTQAFESFGSVYYLKGAPERVLQKCEISEAEAARFKAEAARYAGMSERIIAFAHKKALSAAEGSEQAATCGSGDKYVFDGMCCLTDCVRGEVYAAVKDCQAAGIEVKMLTGDVLETALAVAKKAGLPCSVSNAALGSDLDKMSDEQLKKALPHISIVARSTPETKLRVVCALKEMGEVVAVTGDGVNDAPAVKNADIGIAMGAGSEITKEASDIILIDDSFAVIAKAVAFGRNIYRNFQRFLMFQLTVNFSAVALIIAFLVLGFASPFGALQLLWINVIMDGPLALSLGLERRDDKIMDYKPVKRTDGIVTARNFARIIAHAAFIVAVIISQKLFNFLGAGELQKDSVIFSLFVIFQLFNALNSREAGSASVINAIGKNKPFSALFALSLVMQIIITDYCCAMFKTSPLGAALWIKITSVCFSVVVVSECYKAVYRAFSKSKFYKKIIKRRQFA